MKTTDSKKMTVMSIVLAFLFLIPSWAGAGQKFGRIVVFGTSLSDSGNLFALTGMANTPPYGTLDPLLVPSAPYDKGGHHFSNGATWVEQFSRPLGLAGDTRPAFEGPGTKATNYAVGGARARDDGINANLSYQVSAFLTTFKGRAPSDGLYVIEMGSNDIRDALTTYASGENGDAVLQDALESIATNIGRLYAAGARQFLVWNVPDIGLTPAMHILDPSGGAAYFASLIAMSFNSNLDGVLGLLRAYYPGIQLTELDVFTILREITGRPVDFDLTVVDEACVMPNAPPYECQVPDEYLFWDGIHPTKVVHAIVAQDAALVLALK
jgi:phospholipase/lecithinase/hemolysin